MDMFDTVSASERGAWLHLTNPATGALAYLPGEDGRDDLNKPVRIQLLGPDSTTFKRATKARSVAALKRRRGKTDISKMTEAELSALIDEGEVSRAETAADATIGWENIVSGGKPVPFSREAAADMYAKFPSLLRQVDEFIASESNFFERG